MTKRRLAVLFLLVFVVVLAVGLLHTRKAYAQSSQGVAIPKSYGTCRGGTVYPNAFALIFEDSSGTIRLVDVKDGGLLTTYVRR